MRGSRPPRMLPAADCLNHLYFHWRSGSTNHRTQTLEQWKKLRPAKCYIGNELWDGYVVFEFGSTKNVVLECPVEGNATYVLSGEWKCMVGTFQGVSAARIS